MGDNCAPFLIIQRRIKQIRICRFTGMEPNTPPSLSEAPTMCETHNLPNGGSSYLKEAHLCFTKCIFRSSSHTLPLTWHIPKISPLSPSQWQRFYYFILQTDSVPVCASMKGLVREAADSGLCFGLAKKVFAREVWFCLTNGVQEGQVVTTSQRVFKFYSQLWGWAGSFKSADSPEQRKSQGIWIRGQSLTMLIPFLCEASLHTGSIIVANFSLWNNKKKFWQALFRFLCSLLHELILLQEAVTDSADPEGTCLPPASQPCPSTPLLWKYTNTLNSMCAYIYSSKEMRWEMENNSFFFNNGDKNIIILGPL